MSFISLATPKTFLEPRAHVVDAAMTQPKGEKTFDKAVSRLESADWMDSELTELLTQMGRTLWDGQKHPTIKHRGDKVKIGGSSVAAYLNRLRIDMRKHDFDIREISAFEFNSLMAETDKDRSTRTTRQTQVAARWFFRVANQIDHWPDFGVDPDDIDSFVADKQEKEERKLDPDEIPDTDDIDAIRQACSRKGQALQIRALIEMLAHTGQRIGALQTLKIGDIEANEKPGHFYLNVDEGGLKGAEKRGKRRSLLGAQPYVRDWLHSHPLREDPDAYLFIGDPSHHNNDLSNPWSYKGMNEMIKSLADDAGIDKKITAHSFRHYWVTHMKWERGIDWPEIKAMGGWAEGSNTPEETYSHIEDKNLVGRLEEKLGLAESDDSDDYKRPFWLPENCYDCGEYLEPHWTTCPTCRTHYSPETEDPAKKAKEDVYESKGQAETDEQEEAVDIANKRLKDISPDELRALADEMED